MTIDRDGKAWFARIFGQAGYAFVPLGFVVMGAAVFGWLPLAAAQHLWMAGFGPGTPGLVYLAAGLWIAAFGGFAITYWPILVYPRIQRKATS